MSGITHRENWPKRRVLLYAFVSLCVLITLCALGAYPCEFTERHISSLLSISYYCQNCGLVSVTSTVRDDLQEVNYARDNTNSETISRGGATVASRTYSQFMANLYWNNARLCSLAGVSETGLHRACELLDIPPPSNILSF
jgi:hypothetical protein